MRHAILRSLLLSAALCLAPAVAAQDVYLPEKRLAGDALEFPRDAQSQGLEGWVYYRYTVGTDGMPEDIRIVGSSGESFERAVTHMVSSYRFEPATLNGEPIKTYSETQLATFLLEGRPQHMRRNFRNSHRKASRFIGKGRLKEARELIDDMAAKGSRNLYEELYFQSLNADYFAASGDTEREYQHLRRVLEFPRYDYKNHRLVDNLYYLPYLFRAYQFEVSQMMVADAFATAQWMQAIDPDNQAVRNVQDHAAALRQQLQGNGYQIQGKILAPLYQDDMGDWAAPLLRKEVELSIPEDSAERILLKCENGSKQLDYKPGVAWIIPAEWQDCALHIRGRIGTRFTITEYPEGALLAGGQ